MVVLGIRILSRLLIIHGHSYIYKFATKTGGFIIMKQRLKRWWHVPALWPVVFSMLYGIDVAKVDIDQPLDLFHLVETFRQDGKAAVGCPDVFPVIAGMLKSGFGVIVTAHGEGNPQDSHFKETGVLVETKGRAKSLSLTGQLLTSGMYLLYGGRIVLT